MFVLIDLVYVPVASETVSQDSEGHERLVSDTETKTDMPLYDQLQN